jgi:3-deoxy-D-manno-octulosonic-acid transferase
MQKIFSSQNYEQISKSDYLIHFASIGELNSIKYLIDCLDNNKIVLSCSTLSSFEVSKKRYPNLFCIFLPLDFFWNVNIFLSKTNFKKILWIDSEIWPNWLLISNQKNLKNILVNGRISDKSYARWSKYPKLSKIIGSQYNLIFAQSKKDQEKISNIFGRLVYFYGNLKFNIETNIPNTKRKIVCFASIHLAEYDKVLKIIKGLKLNEIHEVVIIPRHIQYFENLNKKIISENLKKITIHNKFGDSMSIFERSKIVFMGGSLIEHGGQNPLEPLSHGCFVLSGSFNKNFEEIYLDLEKLNLCKTMNSDSLDLISNEINNLVKVDFNNSTEIENFINTNKNSLKNITEMIEKC